MQWTGFSLGEALSRTVVHFFPTNVGSTLPYPAEVKISIFAPDIERKSVILDGARIGQPDGIRIEDAFPILSEGALPLYGVELSVGSNQPRVDLSPSQCLVEFNAQGLSCRYWPQLRIPEAVKHKVVPLCKDSFMSPSLVLVNATDGSISTDLALQGRAGEPNGKLPTCNLAAREVKEVVINPDLFATSQAQECSWGLVRTRALIVPEESPRDLLIYLLYRDSKTRRPLSVCSI